MATQLQPAPSPSYSPPLVRPAHRECWLRDPDGYTIVISSPDGEAA